MHIVCDTDQPTHRLLFMSIILVFLGLVIWLGTLSNQIANLTEKTNKNIELQQVAIELIKQSAVTQNAVLEAFGKEIDKSKIR